MPCKCLTGCINKKCSCRAKGVACSYECTYCAMKDKYECFNVPGKEPPVKAKSKPKSKRSSRKNSKVSEDSDYSEDEKAVVVASKEITKKNEEKGGEDDDKVIHQTVIINNYYSHNEYKQQNNAYTQIVNHHYENSDNTNTNSDQKVDHLIKNLSLSDTEDDSKSPKVINLDSDDEEDTNSKNKNKDKATLPKLNETLANDFLKFYWECLSTKTKTKYLEKYVCSAAELRIQGVPFIGSKVIVNRLEEAAPMKVNKMEFHIYPTETPATKKFSVTEINKKLLQQQPVKALASSSSAAEDSSKPSKDDASESSTTSSAANSSNSVNKLLATYHRNHSPSPALNNSKESKSLVFSNPNLSPIGRIETEGVMMDANGYTAEFTQNFYLVYNKILNLVQFNNSELKWKV